MNPQKKEDLAGIQRKTKVRMEPLSNEDGEGIFWDRTKTAGPPVPIKLSLEIGTRSVEKDRRTDKHDGPNMTNNTLFRYMEICKNA